MPLFNVEIRATNNYTAGLAVTENPLSIGGGWSEKMPYFTLLFVISTNFIGYTSFITI